MPPLMYNLAQQSPFRLFKKNIIDKSLYFILFMKQFVNIIHLLKISIVFCALALLGCPYIDHGTSDAPELVTTENIQGCYYSENFNEDTYMDKKHFDNLVCKKMCFEGDSVLVNVRAFALIYDTTGLYVEDTIHYTLRGTTVTYDTTDSGIKEVNTSWSSQETVYSEKFPVFFKEPAIDGIFQINVVSNFPTSIYLEKPSYYTGSFEMAVHFDQDAVFSKERGYKKFTVKKRNSVEIFSAKGWDVCNGF